MIQVAPDSERAATAINKVLASFGLGPEGTAVVRTPLQIETEIAILVDLLDRQTPARQRLIWKRIDLLLETWPLAASWHERSPLEDQ